MTEILFPIKPLNSINDLTDYILFKSKNDDIPKHTKDKISKISKVKSVLNKNYDDTIFCPKETDQLFWCFYVLLNDITTYYDNKYKAFTIEHEYKIQAIEQMRNVEFKDKLKIRKIRVSVIEDELVNSTKISGTTVKALCLLHDINMIIVNPVKRTCFICGSNDLSHINIIYIDNERFYIKKNNTTEEFNKIKKEYYLLESLEKPIKSISSYTAPELQTISCKLGIDLKTPSKSKTKQQLYTEIMERL